MGAATAPVWGPLLAGVIFNLVVQPIIRRRVREHLARRHSSL